MASLKSKFAARNAKALRGRMTDAELKLWYHLRDRRFWGFKFVRQLPVGPYIADFACREADLIIEIDGGQHGRTRQDEERTTVLSEHGYAVIRFWNTDVLTNIDGVLERLKEYLEKAPAAGLRFEQVKIAASAAHYLSLGGEVGAKRRVRGPLPYEKGEPS